MRGSRSWRRSDNRNKNLSRANLELADLRV